MMLHEERVMDGWVMPYEVGLGWGGVVEGEMHC